MNLKNWQYVITQVAEAHGFSWKPEEIDTVLLRIHSEVSEAAEAVRDQNWEEFAEELADIFIRLANCAEVMGIDLDDEVAKKHEYNKKRPYLHGRQVK